MVPIPELKVTSFRFEQISPGPAGGFKPDQKPGKNVTVTKFKPRTGSGSITTEIGCRNLGPNLECLAARSSAVCVFAADLRTQSEPAGPALTIVPPTELGVGQQHNLHAFANLVKESDGGVSARELARRTGTPLDQITALSRQLRADHTIMFAPGTEAELDTPARRMHYVGYIPEEKPGVVAKPLKELDQHPFDELIFTVLEGGQFLTASQIGNRVSMLIRNMVVPPSKIISRVKSLATNGQLDSRSFPYNAKEVIKYGKFPDPDPEQ